MIIERQRILPRDGPHHRRRYGAHGVIVPPSASRSIWRRSGTIADVGEVVGHIVVHGREPFDIVAQRLPSAMTENKIVVATLPIFAPGFPGNSTEIRLLLTPPQAEDLARQLLVEAKKAREGPPQLRMLA